MADEENNKVSEWKFNLMKFRHAAEISCREILKWKLQGNLYLHQDYPYFLDKQDTRGVSRFISEEVFLRPRMYGGNKQLRTPNAVRRSWTKKNSP